MQHLIDIRILRSYILHYKLIAILKSVLRVHIAYDTDSVLGVAQEKHVNYVNLMLVHVVFFEKLFLRSTKYLW